MCYREIEFQRFEAISDRFFENPDLVGEICVEVGLCSVGSDRFIARTFSGCVVGKKTKRPVGGNPFSNLPNKCCFPFLMKCKGPDEVQGSLID